MWPDWVSNPGPLPLESDVLPTALRGPAVCACVCVCVCVCARAKEREKGCLYSHVSVGNSTLKKSYAFFPGAKTTTRTWKSFRTFRVTKQTFTPTYMHQKILIKLDNIGENASKICCLPRENAFCLLD